jgi:lipopolysaccharide/colanic/teichoic acid biosynthesis glycosyltransferase
MRRTSLDELPQLINVVRGQMTLVGPRPETPALAAKYPAALQWVLDETPGLTGPAQITLRDDVTISGSADDVEQWYIERLVPRRVAADLTFLCRPTLLATMHVIVMTVRYLLRGRRPAIRAGA